MPQRHCAPPAGIEAHIHGRFLRVACGHSQATAQWWQCSARVTPALEQAWVEHVDGAAWLGLDCNVAATGGAHAPFGVGIGGGRARLPGHLGVGQVNQLVVGHQPVDDLAHAIGLDFAFGQWQLRRGAEDVRCRHIGVERRCRPTARRVAEQRFGVPRQHLFVRHVAKHHDHRLIARAQQAPQRRLRTRVANADQRVGLLHGRANADALGFAEQRRDCWHVASRAEHMHMRTLFLQRPRQIYRFTQPIAAAPDCQRRRRVGQVVAADRAPLGVVQAFERGLWLIDFPARCQQMW